ncbi:MAG: amidohydrolase family protein, partial [Oscillospiraceae bacterium]|nr:amidohydrolase family protein [Oscillospiraceae bacterium]
KAMFKSSTTGFGELREYIEHLPVIETHEHYTKYVEAKDALEFIKGNYYHADYISAGGEEGHTKGETLKDRYERFLRTYKKSDKTAYARGMQEGLRICWGVDDVGTFEGFKAFEEKFKGRDASVYDRFMESSNIRAKVVDQFDMRQYFGDKPPEYSKYTRFAFSLPSFHNIHAKGDVLNLQRFLDRPIKSLDDYVEAFDAYLAKSVEFGVVCMKDQTAYRRAIAYGYPAKAEAERAFNDLMFNPRDIFGDDRVRALDDWLFHHAMRKAAGHGLPVQLHTGHMAGVRNDIVKTNASHLIPTLELHQDVMFDLFHGNWPYMDEYLFIGKNYPNAYLNLCWAQQIDPLYCIELMKRAVMTVPHSKVFAFGGDTGAIEWVVGYLSITKDNVAIALSELADSGWLSMDEAKELAKDWFFDNPNEFFKLGLEG